MHGLAISLGKVTVGSRQREREWYQACQGLGEDVPWALKRERERERDAWFSHKP